MSRLRFREATDCPSVKINDNNIPTDKCVEWLGFHLDCKTRIKRKFDAKDKTVTFQIIISELLQETRFSVFIKKPHKHMKSDKSGMSYSQVEKTI